MEHCKPDFKKAYIAATEKLVQFGKIGKFPIQISGLLKEHSDIQLHTFGWAERHGVSRSMFQSESAELQECNGMHAIYYDETKPHTHSRFSIAHEWAHYDLRHDFDAAKDDALYKRQEAEANFFAAQLLMPDQVIRELQQRGNRITAPFIQRTFCVSEQAAGVRMRTLQSFPSFLRSPEEREFDDILLGEVFSAWLNASFPRRILCDSYAEYEKQAEREKWFAEGY